MPARAEAPENFGRPRRCFPRARGKGVLGQIGKWGIYKPARWLHEHSPQGEAYLTSRLKRAIDLVSVIPLSLIGAPIILTEASYVAFRDKTWPFYALPCVGKDGKIFGRLKIKTMAEEARDMPGYEIPMLIKSPDDPRITHSKLRGGIDELPQIINVLKGEMSVVGTTGRPKSEIDYFEKVISWRPKLKGRVEKYLELYPKAKPGITGPCQVMGRANLTLTETSLIEGWYLENASWVVDASIILGTIPAVKSGVGAY